MELTIHHTGITLNPITYKNWTHPIPRIGEIVVIENLGYPVEKVIWTFENDTISVKVLVQQ